MTIKGLLKTGGLTALATAMAVTALPAAAAPGDHDRGSHSDRGGNGGNGDKAAPAPSRAPRDAGGDRGDRGSRAPGGGAPGAGAPASRTGPAPMRAGPAGAPRTVAERGGPGSGARPAWSSNRGGQPPRAAPGNRGGSQYDARGHDGRGHDDRGHDDRGRGSWNGNRGGNDNHNGSWNGNRGGNGQWDRNWRGNSRYNWSSYRSSHRSIFHLGSYYSPYRNYSYRPLSIGFYLDSLFYSNRYWIDDPYQYRLPDAYGDYRWVRYYDDALLVDVYTGEVVDVMHDFFW